MKIADRSIGAALVVTGIAIAAAATTYRVGFMTDPVGPRALPYLTALMMGCAGALIFARPEASSSDLDRAAARRTGGAVLTFAGYALVLPLLGFFLSTALVILGLARLFGGPWRPSIASALSTAGALWLLFVALLQLPLPVGSLWMR